jgi:L-fuconate dehydratase
MTRITGLRTIDVRFPTSRSLDGSDAMNPDPDYSAAYVVLDTDTPGLQGFGLTFTIGRGNELCVAAIEAMRHLVIGVELDWVKEDPARFWRRLTGDSQLRWVGPDKGVIHLATGAVVNAVWDLWARAGQAGLGAGGRHVAGRTRPGHRLPLPDRLHQAR